MDVVAKERDMSFLQASQLANGQVYSGRQAMANGLIDMLGTLEDAIYITGKKTGKLLEPKIIYPPKEKKGLLDILIGDIFQSSTLDNLLIFPKPKYIERYLIND